MRSAAAARQSWKGPIRIDIRRPLVCADGEVAFCYGLAHMQGVKVDSTPFYMDGSDRAALDLRP